jgi:hypothetical protein
MRVWVDWMNWRRSGDLASGVRRGGTLIALCVASERSSDWNKSCNSCRRASKRRSYCITGKASLLLRLRNVWTFDLLR